MMAFETLRRIETGFGSRIEPGFDASWGDLTKLQWHAAVVAADSGVFIQVHEGGLGEKHFGIWRKVRGQFGYSFDGGCGGPMSYTQMWAFLGGVSRGARLSRDKARDLDEQSALTKKVG